MEEAEAEAEADPDGGGAGSKRAVWAALVGNVLVAVTKAGAAAFTGSSAMLSKAVHSFVDTGNELLLLYGMRVAKKRADRDHPAGHGRELYFWSFIVALLAFALGAGVSIFQGVHRVISPQPIENAIVSEVVLAAAGTVLAAHFDMPLADGISSILIGLVLACTSTLLARESKSLLIGEKADSALIKSMLEIANAACGTSRANGMLTIQMEVTSLFVKPQNPEQYKRTVSEKFGENLADATRAPQPSVAN